MTAVTRFGPAVALMGLIFFLSAQPGSGTPLATWEIALRKLAHVVEYAALFLLWRRALPGLPAWTAAAIAFGYAITDEIHQSFVELRHGTPLDLLVDGAGIAIGYFAAQLLAARRAG